MTFAIYFCLFLVLCGSLNVNATSKSSRLLTTLDVDVNNFLHCLTPENVKGKKKDTLLTIPSKCESLLEKLAISWLDRPTTEGKENEKIKTKPSFWKRLFCKAE
ncbi:uncharacterized protein LOC111066318 [Drosophila obscura]|uniref:uncharacterized protein LOC111066318 n=1 Tax=Drosophila obscura TaxID=7282 RepID=UPI000B9FFBCD|nr:uncharacterized protein LOC111066318 [Drosophila obscura]